MTLYDGVDDDTFGLSLASFIWFVTSVLTMSTIDVVVLKSRLVSSMNVYLCLLANLFGIV